MYVSPNGMLDDQTTSPTDHKLLIQQQSIPTPDSQNMVILQEVQHSFDPTNLSPKGPKSAVRRDRQARKKTSDTQSVSEMTKDEGCEHYNNILDAVAEIPFEHAEASPTMLNYRTNYANQNTINGRDSSSFEIGNERSSLGNRPSFTKVYERVLGSPGRSGLSRGDMHAPQRKKSKKRNSMEDIPDEDASLTDKISRVSACVGPHSQRKGTMRSGCWGDSMSNISRDDVLSAKSFQASHYKTNSQQQAKMCGDRNLFITSLNDHKRN